ncbi:hypothetical protein O7607_16445 [Micromonospora sp. WMMA1949]|uniref:hypothetical protein n=1 Tax=unclassified Micromonospora TaxID=2617518 RepID=UPI0022B6F438|nr:MULTISPECIES: hypothetical protein [unclassified Micromonospora]MCZ7427327.1 hypothetical protein [Micromonospora sp. WMMA1949]WBC11804.1 hypothetical protein O7604_13395 [Micromonospora sp. WMMA1947]
MKAHRTDIVSFAFGLVFLGLSVWWLLARILGLSVPPVGWFLAGGLVLIGLLGLIGALRSGRAPEQPAPDVTVAAPYGSPAAGAETPADAEAVTDTKTTDGADEWATRATTDSAEPATRELPALDPPAGEAAPERRTPGDPA